MLLNLAIKDLLQSSALLTGKAVQDFSLAVGLDETGIPFGTEFSLPRQAEVDLPSQSALNARARVADVAIPLIGSNSPPVGALEPAIATDQLAATQEVSGKRSDTAPMGSAQARVDNPADFPFPKPVAGTTSGIPRHTTDAAPVLPAASPGARGAENGVRKVPIVARSSAIHPELKRAGNLAVEPQVAAERRPGVPGSGDDPARPGKPTSEAPKVGTRAEATGSQPDTKPQVAPKSPVAISVPVSATGLAELRPIEQPSGVIATKAPLLPDGFQRPLAHVPDGAARLAAKTLLPEVRDLQVVKSPPRAGRPLPPPSPVAQGNPVSEMISTPLVPAAKRPPDALVERREAAGLAPERTPETEMRKRQPKAPAPPSKEAGVSIAKSAEPEFPGPPEGRTMDPMLRTGSKPESRGVPSPTRIEPTGSTAQANAAEPSGIDRQSEAMPPRSTSAPVAALAVDGASAAPIPSPDFETVSRASASAAQPSASPPLVSHSVPMDALSATLKGLTRQRSRTEVTTTELILEPQELGRVRVTLSGGESSGQVSVFVERPETLELVRRHIDLVRADLRAAGWDATEFTLTSESFGGSEGREQEGRDQVVDPEHESSGTSDASEIAPRRQALGVQMGKSLDLRV